MLDKTTRRKILSYLYERYRTSPYEIRDTEEISETLGIPFPEVKSELIYLHKKGFVDSFFDNHEDIWAQKINEKGIDELEKLEVEASAGIDHSLDVSKSNTDQQNPKEELKRYIRKLQDFKKSNGKLDPYNILLSLKTYIGRLDMDNETRKRLLINMEYLRTQYGTIYHWSLDDRTPSEKFLRILNEAYDNLIIYLEEIVERGIPISLKPYQSQASKNPKPTNFFTKILLRNSNKHDDENAPKRHDFFICHATEDKKDIARPLAEALRKKGFDVWYDEFSLRWGRNLMKTIGKGISESRFGIVIFSPNFFEKKWTQLELDGLVEKLNLDNGELLPLLYNMTHEELKKRLLLLSGIFCRSWDEGLEQLISELVGIATGKTEEFSKNRIVKSEFVFKTDSDGLDFTLDKYTENNIHHVGVRNAGGKTIQALMIFCNEQKCAWWDTGDFLPRHLYAGGGWNVHLPRGYANTDPMITVKSNDRILAQTTLSKIVHRPSEKWTAKDEDGESVDRLNITLGRIRSNLGTLQSLFETFLGYPNNMPMTENVEANITQKNELVDSTQLIVNQVSHVLEVDWIQRINDLCTLAKKHPYAIGEKGKFLRCEHCAGIISQIGSLLKDLPNSPI